MTGITVTLLSKQQTGTDAFNRPTYSEISIGFASPEEFEEARRRIIYGD